MKLKKVRFKVPEKYLDHFDEELSGYYASRSEALRASMNLLLENMKEYKKS